MKITSQNKTGLFSNHTSVETRPISHVRMTVPVHEILIKAGADIQGPNKQSEYTIRLGVIMPAGIVAIRIPNHNGIALRLEYEPEYPIEIPDYWLQADWLPCTECGAPLIWYEAGYVPGYRVCSQPPYHHMLLT